MRGHARVSALIRMDIVQLREHHLRRSRAHPLILSTFLPAEAMPPSGHPLILSKESAASVAASASLSSPRTWALGPSLALLVSWACGSWSSHAHPLASCFFSLVWLVSLVVISLVVISLVGLYL